MDPKPWELWYIPYYGQCRIYIINRRTGDQKVVSSVWRPPSSGRRPKARGSKSRLSPAAMVLRNPGHNLCKMRCRGGAATRSTRQKVTKTLPEDAASDRAVITAADKVNRRMDVHQE